MSFTDVLKDETGSYSMARLMCLIWSVVFTSVIVFYPDRANAEFYKLMGGILLACIGWAGGNRALAYVAPIFTKNPPMNDVTGDSDLSKKG